MTTRKEPPPSREEVSIYVGDLDKTVSKHDLFTKFNAKGVVSDIILPIKNGKSLGYAYINYKSPNHVQRALAEFGCITEINGKQCRVMKYSKENKDTKKNNNIFVKNLHSSIDNKSLNDLFSKYGKVISAKVVTDRQTDKSCGYGYVSFQEEQSAMDAVQKTNNMIVSGQQIITEIFITKKEREEKRAFTNVYCKYIPPSWTEQQILRLFNKYGKITNYEIFHLPIGTSACINFAKPEEAKLAIMKLDGLQCGADNVLYVARAQKQKERKYELERAERQRRRRNIESKDWKLYVSNLSYNVSDDDLMRIFMKYGTITTAFIVRNKYTGYSTERGFVGFKYKENAVRAQYEMDGAIYYGRKLYVRKARDNRNYNRNYNGNRKQRTAYIPKISVSSNKLIINSSPTSLPTPTPQSSSHKMMNRNVEYIDDENQSEEKVEADGYRTGDIQCIDQENLEILLRKNVNDGNNKNDEYTENEVSIWLKKEVKLPEYIGLFKNEGVEDMETVQLLKEDDLKEMGIIKCGHKKKIIQYILQLIQEKEGGD